MTEETGTLAHAASNGKMYAVPVAPDVALTRARVDALELGIAADDLRDRLRALMTDAVDGAPMPSGYVDARLVILFVAAKELGDEAHRLASMLTHDDWGAQWLPHALTAWGEVETFGAALVERAGIASH